MWTEEKIELLRQICHCIYLRTDLVQAIIDGEDVVNNCSNGLGRDELFQLLIEGRKIGCPVQFDASEEPAPGGGTRTVLSKVYSEMSGWAWKVKNEQ